MKTFRRSSLIVIAVAIIVGFGAGAYLLVPWKGSSNEADAAGAPKVRPTGNGRFKLLASPAPGATGIPSQTTIKVDAQNGRIKHLTVKGPDGTPVHGYLDQNGEWWLTTTSLAPGTAYNVDRAGRTEPRQAPHQEVDLHHVHPHRLPRRRGSYPATTRSSASGSRSPCASPGRS